MAYIDNFIAAVPTENREKYLKHAAEAGAIFKEYGALKQMECWADDVPEGEMTSFHKAVQRKENEAVVVGWVVWPSKEVRDIGWEKIMQDPRLQPDANPMPFDGKRMIYGGFDVILDI